MEEVIGFTIQMQVAGWMWLCFLVGAGIGYAVGCIVGHIQEAERALADSNKENKI